MKKNNFVFISNSPVLDDVVSMIATRAQEAFDASGKNVQIQYLQDSKIPKRWGGFIIPVHLPSIDATGVKSCYQEIYNTMTDKAVFNMACCLYKDTHKKNNPIIRIALVRKYRKVRKSGILVYWEK